MVKVQGMHTMSVTEVLSCATIFLRLFSKNDCTAREIEMTVEQQQPFFTAVL